MIDLEIDIYELGYDDGVYCAKFGLEKRAPYLMNNEIYQQGYMEGFKRQIIIEEEKESENE